MHNNTKLLIVIIAAVLRVLEKNNIKKGNWKGKLVVWSRQTSQVLGIYPYRNP